MKKPSIETKMGPPFLGPKGAQEGMTACEHPGLYKQAHAGLPDVRKDSPEWKVVLYILTANAALWDMAQRYIRPESNQFCWQEMLDHEGLSDTDRTLVELAGCLSGTGHAVDLGALITLDEHNFEVAMKAIRLTYELSRGRTPL